MKKKFLAMLLACAALFTAGCGSIGTNSSQWIDSSIKGNVTGLSRHYIRNGCRTGTIPHIRAGAKYLVYLPGLLERLEEEARRRRNIIGTGPSYARQRKKWKSTLSTMAMWC